jgi:hypothetical protein
MDCAWPHNALTLTLKFVCIYYHNARRWGLVIIIGWQLGLLLGISKFNLYTSLHPEMSQGARLIISMKFR